MSADVLLYLFVDSVWEAALECVFRTFFLGWAEGWLVFSILSLGVGSDVYVCFHLHHLTGLAVFAAGLPLWLVTAQLLLQRHFVELEVLL